MSLRCCKCGQQSSSSSSRSSVSASASASGSSASVSDQSGSGSGGGGGYAECLICNGQVAPSSFDVSWELANNCPNTAPNPQVGCYDQAVGPHEVVKDQINTFADFSSVGRLIPDSACVWANTSTGEVEGGVDPYYCGSCSNGPAIKVVVGIDDLDQYFIWVLIVFWWECSPGGFPPGPIQEGGVNLLYEKYSELPFNCLALNELDLTFANGPTDFPTPGGMVAGGWGPGCNLAFGAAPFGTGFAESSFPLLLSIQPAT